MDRGMTVGRGLQHHIPEPGGWLAHKRLPFGRMRVGPTPVLVNTVLYRLDCNRALGYRRRIEDGQASAKLGSTAMALSDLAASAGFYGKLPARGDFVRAGLPRDFIDPWDAWLQRMMLASQDALGEAWAEAWLQAPIWRFALPPGLCGSGAVLGLWLPSMDRVGRFFPLTLAAVAAHPWPALVQAGKGFLAQAEAAGLEAVQQDLTPENLGQRVAAAVFADGDAQHAVANAADELAALWWTDRSPLVRPQSFATQSLPEAAVFTAMIAGASGHEGSPA